MRIILFLFTLTLFSCGNTIYIVRHAEKEPVQAGAAGMMASDPPLSEAGRVRAYALRERLRHEHVTLIFSTNTTRTLSTAQPLNEMLGRTKIELYSSKKDSMDLFINRLKQVKKRNVLVVGHSNTIDDLANKLCGKTVVPGDLKDTEYDNLYIIKRRGRSYSFKSGKYGVRTE
ncbi:MAG: histidine phosphatase family protein [Sphingobacteriales bacterium]|nr:histidine phosphatase family protein [Sphingobacteriales bacterium]